MPLPQDSFPHQDLPLDICSESSQSGLGAAVVFPNRASPSRAGRQCRSQDAAAGSTTRLEATRPGCPDSALITSTAPGHNFTEAQQACLEITEEPFSRGSALDGATVGHECDTAVLLNPGSLKTGGPQLPEFPSQQGIFKTLPPALAGARPKLSSPNTVGGAALPQAKD